MVATELEELEQAWVKANLRVVGRAFDLFMEAGEWPKVSDMRRWLAQQRLDADIEDVVRSRPIFDGELRPSHVDTLSLKVRHLRFIPEAERLLEVCAEIAREAAIVYRTPNVEPVLSSDVFPVESRLLMRAGDILLFEHASPLAGGGSDENSWRYFINETLVLDFEDVWNSDEFVAAQDQIHARLAAKRSQYGSPVRVLLNEEAFEYSIVDSGEVSIVEE